MRKSGRVEQLNVLLKELGSYVGVRIICRFFITSGDT